MIAFNRECLADRQLASVDRARLVLTEPGQQHGVQVSEIAGARHGHQVVSSKEPDLTPSTPPFSCPSPGVQKLDAKPQCERNATKRAVSSRRWPRRIFFTAEPRLS
jgi:hypothetical protein